MTRKHFCWKNIMSVIKHLHKLKVACEFSEHAICRWGCILWNEFHSILQTKTLYMHFFGKVISIVIFLIKIKYEWIRNELICILWRMSEDKLCLLYTRNIFSLYTLEPMKTIYIFWISYSHLFKFACVRELIKLFFTFFFSFELYMWDYGKMKKLKWIICFFDIIFRCTIFKILSLRFPDSFVHFYCGVSEANVICLLSQCRNMFSMKIAVFMYLCTVVYWWHNYVANHNQDKCKQKPFQLLVIPFNEYFCTL